MNETKQEIKLHCDFDNNAIACCALDTEKPGYMNDLLVTTACLTLRRVPPVRTWSVGTDPFPYCLLHSILAPFLLRVLVAFILRMVLLLWHA